MDNPTLKLVDPKWRGEKEIKALLATGVKYTLPELRKLAHPTISDYYLNKWIKEAGAPHIKLAKQPGKPRERVVEIAPPNSIWLARAARWIGAGLGVVGLVLNCAFALQFGDQWWQSLVNATSGGLIDLVSMFALAWAFALPLRRHRALAVMLWLLAVVYSFLVGVGFFSTMLGDHARKGAVADQYRADLSAQLIRAEADLAKLREPKTIDAEIQAELDRLALMREWQTSKGCTVITTSDYACAKLKQLKIERDGEAQRAPLKADVERLAAARHALGNASGQDTIAETFGFSSSRSISTYRTIAPALMLAFSGLLIAFASELDKPHEKIDTRQGYR